MGSSSYRGNSERSTWMAQRDDATTSSDYKGMRHHLLDQQFQRRQLSRIHVFRPLQVIIPTYHGHPFGHALYGIYQKVSPIIIALRYNTISTWGAQKPTNRPLCGTGRTNGGIVAKLLLPRSRLSLVPHCFTLQPLERL